METTSPPGARWMTVARRRAGMAERVALATSAALATLPDDDRLLIEPLARRGIAAEPVVWDDPAARWTEYDAVVIRSCWDYHERHDEFLAWVGELEAAGVPLFNPPAVVRWNADKAYLRVLEAAGTAIVPTLWTEPGEPATLAALLEEAGWDEAVVKPVVSAGARNTWRTSRAKAPGGGAVPRARATGAVDDPAVPPRDHRGGRWSLVFFGGRFSHAVVKRPRPGRFPRPGGVRRPRHGGGAGPSLVAAAETAIRHAPEPCLYARVDGCVVDGRFLLMELRKSRARPLPRPGARGGRFAEAMTEGAGDGRR